MLTRYLEFVDYFASRLEANQNPDPDGGEWNDIRPLLRWGLPALMIYLGAMVYAVMDWLVL